MANMIEIALPDIGDFHDVEIIEILVSPGDTVAAEDSLLTLESDKATMEIPSPQAGTVSTRSAANANASPPDSRIRCATNSAHGVSTLQLTATFAPARASNSQQARPIPREPPVTSAALPLRSIIGHLPVRARAARRRPAPPVRGSSGC